VLNSVLPLVPIAPEAERRADGRLGTAKILDLKTVQPLAAIDRTSDRFASAKDFGESGASLLDEWQSIASTLTDPEQVRFIAAGTLATILGFPTAAKCSASLSRKLAHAVAARGLAIEPDAQYGGAAYRKGR